MMRGTELGRQDQHHGDEEQTGLEGDHARVRVARVRAAGLRQDHDEQREADGHEPDATTGAADLEAEDALGQDGEEDEAAGQDRLHQRQRREGHGGDVQQPGEDRDAHADGEPLRGPELPWRCGTGDAS